MDSECNPFLSNDFHEEEKTAVEIDSKVEAMEQDLGQESMCQLRSDESELEAGGDEPDDNNKVCQEQVGENDLTSVYGSDVSNDGALSDEPDERSFPLSELYPYIRCALCNGFFIDATTITECLHTFCKSCIVKHFFYSNRCPNCNVVVHQTQPLYNIRLDRQLQDIVYKMVPHLEGTERGRLHDFYKERGLEVPKPATSPPAPAAKAQKQKKGPVPQSVFTIPSELDVSLMLEAEEGIEKYKPLERKYVRVSGEATIRHVELFIRRKMELNPSCQVDVVCGDHLLDRYQSLREVRNFMGEGALQDGLLVLHFGLVQAPSV